MKSEGSIWITAVHMMMIISVVWGVATNAAAADQIDSATSSAQPAPLKRYYLHLNHSTGGPFTAKEIQTKIDKHEISRDTLICEVGADSWMAITAVFKVPKKKWYVAKNGVVEGPYTESELSTMEAGTLHPDRLVLPRGAKNWVRAETEFSFSKEHRWTGENPQPKRGTGWIIAGAVTLGVGVQLALVGVMMSDIIYADEAAAAFAGVGLGISVAGLIQLIVGISRNQKYRNWKKKQRETTSQSISLHVTSNAVFMSF